MRSFSPVLLPPSSLGLIHNGEVLDHKAQTLTPPFITNHSAPTQEISENKNLYLLHQGSTDIFQCFIFVRISSTKASRTAPLRVGQEIGYFHGLEESPHKWLLIMKKKRTALLLAGILIKWTRLYHQHWDWLTSFLWCFCQKSPT